MASSLQFEIPVDIKDVFTASTVYENYTQAGSFSSYGVDLELSELGLYKTLKSKELEVLSSKIRQTGVTWAEKYRRHQEALRKEARSLSVEELNEEAAESIRAIEEILLHTLSVDDAVEFQSLKSTSKFSIEPGQLYQEAIPGYIKHTKSGKPGKLELVPEPQQPTLEDAFKSAGFIARLFSKKKVTARFEAALQKWEKDVDEVKSTNDRHNRVHAKATEEYQRIKQAWQQDRKDSHAAIDQLEIDYHDKQPSAIQEYCEVVLTQSSYPDLFPKNWDLEYRGESKVLVVDYDLPAPSDMPQIEAYTYVKSRDEVKEKLLTEAKRKKLYESAIYQICIRTMHEIFEADVISAVDVVAFNGIVTAINPATGKKESKVIVSASANKEEFNEFDLSMIDAKATFKHLKGVSAASLIGLTPVHPVIALEKTDRRFIASKDVIQGLDASSNLAAMDWGEFEHLIREVFEQEFAVNGGEVKVTQASSDGGVDAIAFDPDPIRGGKIVIQAKRYTNTVGVAAVRDLYGTVMNEGATKGILVTTSDYGSDSYNFAKDKPLTLLSGANLLALLDKHGHKATINIAEAKLLQMK